MLMMAVKARSKMGGGGVFKNIDLRNTSQTSVYFCTDRPLSERILSVRYHYVTVNELALYQHITNNTLPGHKLKSSNKRVLNYFV